ncbi:hypothetical protein PQQ87_24205 [Paraburkholderia nemoris]|uniref:hypothetical protein n=1 Tax=Paraburkholderia nemoris TaxID=2793076 RepID=UPI0038BB41B3
MTYRPIRTGAEQEHVDDLLPKLFGLVKVTKLDGTEIVGLPNLGVGQGEHGPFAHVLLTLVDGQRVDVDLLDIATVVSAFLEHRAAFVAAGVMDLTGSPTIH